MWKTLLVLLLLLNKSLISTCPLLAFTTLNSYVACAFRLWLPGDAEINDTWRYFNEETRPRCEKLDDGYRKESQIWQTERGIIPNLDDDTSRFRRLSPSDALPDLAVPRDHISCVLSYTIVLYCCICESAGPSNAKRC